MSQRQPYLAGELHRLSVGGRDYVLDVSTSAAFRTDGPAGEVLDAFCSLPREAALRKLGSSSRPDIGEAIREWDALAARGLFRPRAPHSPPPGASGMPPTMELSLTHRCTMRCRYCYSPHDAKRSGLPADMSKEVVDASLHWLVNHWAKDSDRCHVTTGVTGEALLRLDMIDYVRQRVEESAAVSGKAVSWAVGSTNLTLASDPAVWELVTSPGGIVFGISLDGPQHVHDAMRPFADGRASYERIVPFARKLLQQGHRCIAQAVLTGRYPNVTEVFLHLYELGFPRVCIRPVRARSTEPYAINADTIESVKQGYTDFVEFLLNQDDTQLLRHLLVIWNDTDFVGRYLRRISSRWVALYRCSAGKDDVCVDTNGDIYPCPGMIGIPGCKIGSVFAGFDEQARKVYYEDLVVTRLPACKACWARHLCGGGCYHSALLENGRLDVPSRYDCELTQHLIALAIYLMDRLRWERPQVFRALPQAILTVVNESAVVPCRRAESRLGPSSSRESWTSTEALLLNRGDQMQRRLWHGPTDISGEVHLRWDDEYLYVMAELSSGRQSSEGASDAPEDARNGGQPSLDLFITSPIMLRGAFFPDWWDAYVEYHQVEFPPGLPKAVIHTGREEHGGSMETTEVPATWEKCRGRVRVLTALPWRELSLVAGRPGEKLAVNVSLHASDDEPGEMKWEPTCAFGLVRLLS